MEAGSTQQRRVVGLLAGLALVGLAALVLLPSRDSVTVATPALVLVVPGIVAGLVGGRLAGMLTAAVAALVLDVAFIEPYGRPTVHLIDDVVALTAFGAVALTVATLVAQANDRRRAAEQRAQEVLRLSEEKARIERDQHRLSLEKTALEQAEDARRALLRSVSHDLRTPLAAIRAITSDLRSGASYDARTRDELLDVVGDEAERLDRLVANLLSLSRIEAGALEPDLQAVDLAELLDDRVRRLSPVLRDVRVETRIPVGLPLVDADYTLLDQVVTNLLENAARHAPSGSVIRIDAEEAGDLMAIAVSDEGDGVPPSQREWIFEPFRTGDTSRAGGIGLAICKAIVEAHGGSITVADTHPDARLPAPPPPTGPTGAPTGPTRAGPPGAGSPPPPVGMVATPPPTRPGAPPDLVDPVPDGPTPPGPAAATPSAPAHGPTTPAGPPAARPGARFTFTLPIHRMGPASEAPGIETPPVDASTEPRSAAPGQSAAPPRPAAANGRQSASPPSPAAPTAGGAPAEPAVTPGGRHEREVGT